MSTLCIFHGGCIDGLTAAAVAKKFIPEVEFFAGQYGDPPPLDLARGKEVFVVDFSYQRGPMLELIEAAAHTTVLDHHKTAEAELAGIDHPRANIVFDMKRSGAGMTWDYFQPPPRHRPHLIDYVEDRDLWRFRFAHTRDVNHYLQCLPQTVEAFHAALDGDVDVMAREGAAIGRYVTAKVAELKAKAFDVTIAGHTVPVVNAPVFLASEVAGELSEGRPFAASFVSNDKEEFWSLRSRDDGGVDVSEVAKGFGGGGHRNAAGFRVPRGTVFGATK